MKKFYWKHALQLEIEYLRGAAQVMTHIQDGRFEEVDDGLAALKFNFKKKERELEDLDLVGDHFKMFTNDLVSKNWRLNGEKWDWKGGGVCTIWRLKKMKRKKSENTFVDSLFEQQASNNPCPDYSRLTGSVESVDTMRP
mgnify:FL=1